MREACGGELEFDWALLRSDGSTLGFGVVSVGLVRICLFCGRGALQEGVSGWIPMCARTKPPLFCDGKRAGTTGHSRGAVLRQLSPSRFLISLRLFGEQILVQATPLHQLLVGADLNDFAPFKHIDPICIAYGRKPMCHHNGRGGRLVEQPLCDFVLRKGSREELGSSRMSTPNSLTSRRERLNLCCCPFERTSPSSSNSLVRGFSIFRSSPT